MQVKKIPGTTGFSISECGTVFDPDGNPRNTYLNGDGYVTASVKKMDGRWITHGIHRLLALAHIPCPGDPDEYEVNHLDKIVTNNFKPNLEWSKSVDNNSHAALMRNDRNRPLLIATTPEGSNKFLKNIHHASEVIGVTNNDVWNAIKTGNDLFGWTIKHHRFDDPIPKDLHKERITKRDATGRQAPVSVKVKDLDTGEVTEFDTMASAGKEFDTTASHIHQCVMKAGGPIKLFRKRFLIVLGNEDFPDLDPDELEASRNRGARDVLAYDTNHRKFYIFPSAATFIRDARLSKKAVTTTLKKGNLREIDGWLFVYFNDQSKQRIEDHMACPVP
tara:strand:- start:1707 stop:2705 length:999 start_codon:yes stop_codon:yes gene_type:complete